MIAAEERPSEESRDPAAAITRTALSYSEAIKPASWSQSSLSS